MTDKKRHYFALRSICWKLEDLENIINELDKNTLNLSLKEKAAYAASLFKKTATNKNITLKLRKKK